MAWAQGLEAPNETKCIIESMPENDLEILMIKYIKGEITINDYLKEEKLILESVET